MTKYFFIFMGAVVVPVVIVISMTHYAYTTGVPPFNPDWPVYSIVVGLGMGTVSIAQLPVRGVTRRFAIFVAYISVVSIMLWSCAYLTGCFSGDC